MSDQQSDLRDRVTLASVAQKQTAYGACSRHEVTIALTDGREIIVRIAAQGTAENVEIAMPPGCAALDDNRHYGPDSDWTGRRIVFNLNPHWRNKDREAVHGV